MFISERWLALATTSFIALCVTLLCTPAFAHDHNHPELTDWYKSLHSRSHTWCCDGDDAETVEEWKTDRGHYSARINGAWIDIPDEALIDGPNRAGQAKIWLRKYGGQPVRCFIPGALT